MADEQPKSLGEVLAKLEQIQENAQGTLDKMSEMEEEFGGSETVSSSPDGSVTVTLNSDAVITDIDIQDSALRLRGNLVNVVLETIKEAQATHAMKLAKMADQAVPEGNLSRLVEGHMSSTVRDRARDNFD
ncbi:YbaB/EbfC family nucleoid-associated protein [Haloglycomyces albus]|uniref:YbaB/EbfC family nucleoid-associated protein n=1 Tax=Haloglycomyces albus TaxID=526067 RepID=UPI00046CC0E3|nr:YbaB/EbfC family nucleoid-associated protein [Haloglycomyces albus]